MASDIMSSAPGSSPSSNTGLARRSLSIFSRRGSESPSPTTTTLPAVAISGLSIALAPVPATMINPAPAPALKSKKWKLSRGEPTIPEGTILRAVPKQSPPHPSALSALEREMATSPNEEILRNIGLSPESEPSSPVIQQPIPLGSFTDIPIASRAFSKRERKNSQGEIIGVWKDGCVAWDSKKPLSEDDLPPRPKSAQDTRECETTSSVPKGEKPRIQVVIPKNISSLRHFAHVSFRSNSMAEYGSRRRSISQTMSQDISPPNVTSGLSDDSFQVSALSPPSVTQLSVPKRNSSVVAAAAAAAADSSVPTAEISPPLHAIASFETSSNESVSGDDENLSGCRSSRSSMTSIDSQPMSSAEPVMPEVSSTPLMKRSRNSNLKRGRASRSSSVGSIDKSASSVSTPIRRFSATGPSDLGSPKEPAELEGSPAVVQKEFPSLLDLINIVRTPSTQRPSRLSSSLGPAKLGILFESNEEEFSRTRTEFTPPSPTLSEAERNLEEQITVMYQASPVASRPGSMILSSSRYSVKDKPLPLRPQPVEEAAPAPPPRSARRRSMNGSSAYRASIEATQTGKVLRHVNAEKAPVRNTGLRRSASLRLIAEQEDHEISAESAEKVIHHILLSLHSLDDLFNMSVINGGFYRVFKRYELEIMRSVLRNMSPAAWEHRETCLPIAESDEPDSAAPAPEYSASTYFETYLCDSYTIRAVKAMILERCHSILRAETVKDLLSHKMFTGSRVDDALWRIWTFCSIFGCNKNREEDLIAQMDWLRGGRLAHQNACSSTISCSDSFYLSSTLLGCPEHFAMGNQGGLSAEELYDMTEMWNCLSNISQSFIGKTELARQHGIFDNTDVEGGDIDGEEAMLEEWHSYMLTLGLSPILDLAKAVTPLYAFSLAGRNKWTKWTPPPPGGSRSTFLREAVARVYEERISVTFSPIQSASEEMREIRRRRGESLASELRQRKASVSGAAGMPDPEERPMSRTEDVLDRLSSGPLSLQPSPVPAPRRPVLSAFQQQQQQQQQQQYVDLSPIYSPMTQPALRSPTRAPPPPPKQHHRSPSALSRPAPRVPSPSGSSSSVSVYEPEPQTPPFQLSMMANNSPLHTVERAIFRIVEMGFTSDQAKAALRLTDMGDGLRVDRAVEYLLSQ